MHCEVRASGMICPMRHTLFVFSWMQRCQVFWQESESKTDLLTGGRSYSGLAIATRQLQKNLEILKCILRNRFVFFNFQFVFWLKQTNLPRSLKFKKIIQFFWIDSDNKISILALIGVKNVCPA